MKKIVLFFIIISISYISKAQGSFTITPESIVSSNQAGLGRESIVLFKSFSNTPPLPNVYGAGRGFIYDGNNFSLRFGASYDGSWKDMGLYSIVMGENSQAQPHGSIALGRGLRADTYYGTVVGNYNIPGALNAFVVGTGRDDERNNALTVKTYGYVGIQRENPHANLHIGGRVLSGNSQEATFIVDPPALPYGNQTIFNSTSDGHTTIGVGNDSATTFLAVKPRMAVHIGEPGRVQFPKWIKFGVGGPAEIRGSLSAYNATFDGYIYVDGDVYGVNSVFQAYWIYYSSENLQQMAMIKNLPGLTLSKDSKGRERFNLVQALEISLDADQQKDKKIELLEKRIEKLESLLK